MKKISLPVRVTAAGLACTTMLSLTACGISKNPSSATSTAASAQTEQTAETGDAVTMRIGRAPSGDFKFGRGESWENNAWLDLYKENGLNVETLYSVDPSTEKDKLAQVIASGDYPDILVLDAASYANYASQNVIMDITDLYEKELNENGKKYLALDDGAALSSARINGKIYGLPALGSGYDSAMLLFVRRDWLKKLNLEMPKTMDDVIQVARAFTTQDPDGNGVNDTYGLGINGKELFHYWGGIQAVFENYGCMPGYWGGNFQFIEKDGQAIWGGANEEGMIQGLTTLQNMYKEGLIPQDFVTANGDQICQDFTSGKVGMVYAPMWGAMSPAGDALATQPDADFACIGAPSLTADGKGTAFLPVSTDYYYCVSSKCEHPEAFFKIFNLSMDKLVFSDSQEDFSTYKGDSNYSAWKTSVVPLLYPYQNLENYQKESVALKSGDMAGLDAEQVSNTENMQYYLDHKTDWNTLSEDDFSKYKAGLGLYTVFADDQGGYAAINGMIENNQFFTSTYNSLPTTLMSEKYPVLDKMTKEFIINVVVGNKQPSDYSAFLQSWMDQGGKEITEEANAWYQANMK